MNDDVLFDIVKYSNGDIIIEFTSSYMSPDRTFFGLKGNGKYLFGDEKLMSSVDSYISISDDDGNSASKITSFIAKDENNNQYIISTMKAYESYFEIYIWIQKVNL